MSYFGGLGAGKGWLKLLFLVGPEVLRDILVATKPVLVVTNARVSADYDSTPLDDYIDAYTHYLEAMLESAEETKRARMNIYMGMATSLNQFSPEPCPDARYKLMNPEEPVVSLSPLTLYYDSRRGQLCTNVSSDLYFGMELSFPRVISLDRDRHEVLYDTKTFSTHGIFQDVTSRIRNVTSPCRIRSPSREHRTPIRVTKDIQDRMKGHPGLKAANLEIV